MDPQATQDFQEKEGMAVYKEMSLPHVREAMTSMGKMAPTDDQLIK